MSRISSFDEYKKAHGHSLSQTEKYWDQIANDFVWDEKWTKTTEGNFENLDIKWFKDGKLNITKNCLDRHLKDRSEKIALYWEPNDPSEKAITYTYQELYEKVCQMANVLTDHDVVQGDRVCFYMSMIPELLISVLACARVGAVHSVVFGGFSAKALAERINDCDAKCVITNNFGPRGNKNIALKEVVDEALEQCPGVNKVLVFKRSELETPMQEGRDIWADQLLISASKEFDATPVDAESPLFILYTSGSTGRPKGLMHTTAGYMVWASETFKQVFQTNDEDVFWCTADIGWITGHSYITYGPLLNGATQVMFEGIPTFPDAGRFWQTIDKYKVTHFYTAPTAIRALQACEDIHYKSADLSSLKVLGSVGEPINEEAWHWYNEEIGKKKCPIVDTWWQTETGGIMISALAGITSPIATYATTPLPGVNPLLVDHEGNEILTMEAEGNLCLKTPWPGMARTIYGDHDRFKQTYFSTFKNLYFTGDGAKRDKNGNYRIIGRVDDVLNVSGHRLGTAEIECALNTHPSITESAVIGIPHDIKGQGIVAFASSTLSPDLFEQTAKEINDIILKEIGPIAKLDQLILVPDLPKTRSGKIMRRILRKIACGEHAQLGDISTLLNPDIVEVIIKRFHK